MVDEQGIGMATPEKALLDFLYFKPARSRLFAALPEIEPPQNFKTKQAWRIVERIPSKRRQTMVANALSELLEKVCNSLQ